MVGFVVVMCAITNSLRNAYQMSKCGDSGVLHERHGVVAEADERTSPRPGYKNHLLLIAVPHSVPSQGGFLLELTRSVARGYVESVVRARKLVPAWSFRAALDHGARRRLLVGADSISIVSLCSGGLLAREGQRAPQSARLHRVLRDGRSVAVGVVLVGRC
jgi:hypothetical protein